MFDDNRLLATSLALAPRCQMHWISESHSRLCRAYFGAHVVFPPQSHIRLCHSTVNVSAVIDIYAGKSVLSHTPRSLE